MALWVCSACSTKFSVGAPACPHCGGLEHEEDGAMPKITRNGGVSNAAEVVDIPPAAAPVVEPEPAPARNVRVHAGVARGSAKVGKTGKSST